MRTPKLPLRGLLAVTLLALAAGALAGCTDARVVGVWSDSDLPAPAHSMLVVSRRGDPAARRLWEDAVAASLQRSGIDATVSYSLFPDGVPNQAALGRALGEHGLDAALVLKPLTASRETHWVPGWNTIQPREYYNPWSGRDVIVYRERHHPGYAYTDRTLREQATVWTGHDGGRMIWAATVETHNPSSPDDLRRDISAGVVPGLRKARVI